MAQRDILEALGYSISLPTPGDYYAQLRDALPVLRAKLITQQAWDHAQQVAWGMINDAVDSKH
jgi:hypothetical protein